MLLHIGKLGVNSLRLEREGSARQCRCPASKTPSPVAHDIQANHEVGYNKDQQGYAHVKVVRAHGWSMLGCPWAIAVGLGVRYLDVGSEEEELADCAIVVITRAVISPSGAVPEVIKRVWPKKEGKSGGGKSEVK